MLQKTLPAFFQNLSTDKRYQAVFKDYFKSTQAFHQLINEAKYIEVLSKVLKTMSDYFKILSKLYWRVSKV